MKEKAKYQIIEDYIINKIQNGELKPGDQIETEKQLSERFNIGHITINKGLNNLVNRNIITRTAGKGSFVKQPMITKSYRSAASFTEDMAGLGMKAGSTLLEYKIITAKDEPEVMENLDLEPNDLVHYFSRIRTADGRPIALQYTYISAKIIPAIDVRALEGSLKQYLDSIGFVEGPMAKAKMSASMTTPEQRALLDVEPTALLLNQHVSFTLDNRPYEFCRTYYLCDRYAFMFEINNSK